MKNLKDVNITGIEISELFFELVCENPVFDVPHCANWFLSLLPSLAKQNYTVQILVDNYNARL